MTDLIYYITVISISFILVLTNIFLFCAMNYLRRYHSPAKTTVFLSVPFVVSDFIFYFTNIIHNLRIVLFDQFSSIDKSNITQTDCILNFVILQQVLGVWALIWGPFLTALCSTLLVLRPQLCHVNIFSKLIISIIGASVFIPTLSAVIETIIALYYRSGSNLVDVNCSRKLVLGIKLHLNIKIIRWLFIIINLGLATSGLLHKKLLNNESSKEQGLSKIRKLVAFGATLVYINSISFILGDINRVFISSPVLEKYSMILQNVRQEYESRRPNIVREMSVVSILLICVVLSFLFSLMHSALLAVILLIKKNRQRQEFLFIAGMALGDITYSIGFFLFTCRRLEYFRPIRELNYALTRKECSKALSPLLLFFGNVLVGNMNIINAIDRFLATFAPLWYYQQTTFHTIRLITISIALALVLSVLNVTLILTSDEVSNSTVSVDCADFAHPQFGSLCAYYQYLCILLSALIYVAIGIAVRRRYKRAQKSSIAAKQVSTKRLVRSSTTMALILLNTLLFLFLPQVLLDLRIASQQHQIIFFFLVLLKTVLNFLIFVSRHEELRSFIIGGNFI